MFSRTLNHDAYNRKYKLGNHKFIQSIEKEGKQKSKNSKEKNNQNHQEIVQVESSVTQTKNLLKQEAGLGAVNNLFLLNEIKNIIYVMLTFPKQAFISVNQQTGDIITNILDIPENYWHIIRFNPETFPENKQKVNLCDIGYWVADKNRVVYLFKGKTVLLLKNDQI
jgi:hypothetical protein